ncbi:twin-arginine translocase subunit TatC [Bacillus sp. 1P06AnD]|uniref:twin-arginine translocase subunit TatC n=1 Tax=Bacillus sp. 1P06AnD TaxID=3132208 RepID=UPI0039A03B37
MNNEEYSITEHLDELRKRIILVAISFIALLIIGFVFVKQMYLFFTSALDYKLMILGPSDIMWIYFHIAGIFAIACTIPIAAHQLWLYVKPALEEHERKLALMYIPGLFLLFVGGLVFGYLFIFPNLLHFLTDLGKGMMVTQFTADRYFTFLIKTTLPFAFAFELPPVMMFLTSIGIINPYKVAKLRKYAYFILVIIACMISPPEFISHISVSIPLIAIFEISVALSKIVYKKKQHRLQFVDMDKQVPL